jgi:Zn-dependent M28 family amino/carboxypeptidase
MTPQQRDLAQRLRQHVTEIGTQERNVQHYAQLEEAAQHIDKTLRDLGYAVRQQVISTEAGPVRNLEVSITEEPAASARSTRKSRPLIVIGAHYDSAIGSPGANDNATGTAAVIELARMLKQATLPDDREIRLVLFVNEEAPYFKSERMGSWVHAQALRERGKEVDAMLSLETLGYYSDEPKSQQYPPPLDRHYPDTGNFIAFVGDIGSRTLVERAIASFRQHTRFPSEGLAAPPSFSEIYRSDHWAYRQFDYPAIMITDTAPYRYPHYHTSDDTPDKVDFDRLARVVEGIRRVIEDLAAPS